MIIGTFRIRCVCHILHRSVVDALDVIRTEISLLREFAKVIRVSSALTDTFKEACVLFGFAKQQIHVPNLDCESRWNTTFDMIDRWFTFEKVAVHLISAARFSSRLEAFADLTKPLTWRVLKSCKDFREDAYNCTKAASGSAYATISMQSLIYKHMKHLCERTAAGRSPCGFTTPAVKRAATAMLTKLTKYEPYMCSKLNLLALLLDPRTSNACDDAKNMKEHLSGTLAANYGYQSAAPPRQEDDVDVAFDLFAEAEGDQAAKDDEVDDFYLMTARADRSCKDILQWWKAHEERFPTISRLARDVFVIQGSSVPCECIFSESGDLIGPDRSSLDPLTVEMHMKLGAWNRLFNEL